MSAASLGVRTLPLQLLVERPLLRQVELLGAPAAHARLPVDLHAHRAALGHTVCTASEQWIRDARISTARTE